MLTKAQLKLYDKELKAVTWPSSLYGIPTENIYAKPEPWWRSVWVVLSASLSMKNGWCYRIMPDRWI